MAHDRLLLAVIIGSARAKPVGFVSYGGTAGGLRAVEQLRLVFAELHTVTVRQAVSLHRVHDLFDGNGEPRDAGAPAAARTMVAAPPPASTAGPTACTPPASTAGSCKNCRTGSGRRSGLRRLTGRRLGVAHPGHPGEERHLSDGEFAGTLTEMFGLQLSAAEAARLTAITRDRDRDDTSESNTSR